ncbi:MAG: DUF2975 domain-containing protein [Bacillota bacterium]
MRRLSGPLHTVFKVFFWVSVAVGVAAAVFMIIVLAAPAETWQQAVGDKVTFSLSGVVRYHLDYPPDQVIDLKPLFLVGSCSLAVGSAMLALICKLLAGILRQVTEGHPFAPGNANKITAIAAIVMVGSLVVNLIQAAMAYAGIVVFDIPNITINISPNLSMFFVGLLLLILAGIFKYGSYLQDEVDATL